MSPMDVPRYRPPLTTRKIVLIVLVTLAAVWLAGVLFAVIAQNLLTSEPEAPVGGTVHRVEAAH